MMARRRKGKRSFKATYLLLFLFTTLSLCFTFFNISGSFQTIHSSEEIFLLKPPFSSRYYYYYSSKNKEETKSPLLLNVWIARTVSVADIENTLRDITALDDENRSSNGLSLSVHVEWKLFCFQNEAYNILTTQTNLTTKIVNNKSSNEKVKVEILFAQGKHKMYFWENYLNHIPSYVDYVWLVDGDISLISMAWSCFWRTILKYSPAISQPAIINPTDKTFKWWAGVTHPNYCEQDCMKDRFGTNVHYLEAIEVSVVEMQLVLFSRQAWTTIHDIVSSRFYPNQWGSHGIDTIWCRLVDKMLHNITIQERQLARYGKERLWGRAQETCTILSVQQQQQQQFPVSCMIIHSTPVKHLDTKSYKLQRESSGNKQFVQQEKQAHQNYVKLFPEFALNTKEDIEAHEKFYNPRFLSSHEQCQDCKTFDCSDDSIQRHSSSSTTTTTTNTEVKSHHKQAWHYDVERSTDHSHVVVEEDSTIILQTKIRYRYPKARMETPTSIIVGVLSSNLEMRQVIRETWARRTSVLFLVAGNWTSPLMQEEMIKYQDLLHVDLPESNRVLPFKTMTFLHAVRKHSKGYDYIYKTEDSVYLRLDLFERQVKYFNKPDYIGMTVTTMSVSEKSSLAFNIGAGFALSSNALGSTCFGRGISNLSFSEEDDKLVGRIAKQCKISPVYDGWEYNDNPWMFDFWDTWDETSERLLRRDRANQEVVNLCKVNQPYMMRRQHIEYCLEYSHSGNCIGYDISCANLCDRTSKCNFVQCGGNKTAASCDKCPAGDREKECAGDCHWCKWGTVGDHKAEEVMKKGKLFWNDKKRCVPVTEQCRTHKDIKQMKKQ